MAADTSLKGKLRRRYSRLMHRRSVHTRPERPMVTFSFDDAPASAARTGAALLEARGVHGTWFISSGMVGDSSDMGPMADAQDIRRLLSAGHEIGCHTRSHLGCGLAAAAEISADVAANAARLAELGAPMPETFAYPFGDVSPAAKQVLAPRYFLLRALHHGMIEPGADLNQAPAVGIEGDDGQAVASRWIARALERRAWLILYTHDVQDSPSPWGCTPAALEGLIDMALQGGADIVTATEGCHRLGPAY